MGKNDDSPTRLHPDAKLRLEGGDEKAVMKPQSGLNRAKVMSTAASADATRMAPQKQRKSQVAPDTTRIARKQQPATSKPLVLKPGALVRNRFLLQKEIGRGGMGIVYTARDLRKEEVGDHDSQIAIKFLSEVFKRYPDSLRMLQQETRKAQQLAHPNVITVYDFDRDGDNVYMTMEYLIGTPLDDYLDECQHIPLGVSEALSIIEGIVKGLEYAHEQGVVHSDLKPGNVFLTEDGVAKIVDFGIARAMKEGEAVSGIGVQNSDSQALFALTPGYASLEMFRGAPPDPKDDIYALACISYKLLSGKHPYKNLPANEAHDQGIIPEPIEGLTERQWQALKKGLALEGDDRVASARAFLDGFLPKRKEPWKYVAAVAAIGMVLTTAYFVTLPPPEALLTEEELFIVSEELNVAKESMDVGAIAVAFENYKMILALPPYDKHPPGQGFVQQPHNREAMGAMDELLDLFERESLAAIEDGRLADAEGFIDAGLSVPIAVSRFQKLKNRLPEFR